MGSTIFKEIQWGHHSKWIYLTKTVRFLKLAKKKQKKTTSAATVIKSILSVFCS